MIVLPIKHFTWDKKVNILTTSLSKCGITQSTLGESFIIEGVTYTGDSPRPTRAKFNYSKDGPNELEYAIDRSWGDTFSKNNFPLIAIIKLK